MGTAGMETAGMEMQPGKNPNPGFRVWQWRIWLRGPSLALVAAAVGVGCATPAPIYRLNPRASDLFWVAGRPSIQGQAAGVRAAVAFEHQDGQTLGIRVEVVNQGEVPIDVKPQDFSYVTCSGEDIGSCGAAKSIVDPERMLTSLDENESREEADATNQQAVYMSLILLSAVGEVAGAGHGHGHRHDSGGLRTAAIADDAQVAQLRHETATASFADQRQLWANQALRHNTLLPGDGAAGFVYVPLEPSVKYVWLTVRAGGQRIPFCFQQSMTAVIDPPRPPGMSFSTNR